MIKQKIKGIVHWCNNDHLLRSVGRRIDQSFDNGKTFEKIGTLNFGFTKNIAAGHRLTRRLARAQIKHVLPLDQSGEFFVVACKKQFRLNAHTGHVEFLGDLVGSHPLRICRHRSDIFYGEYRSNAQRSPINIWRSKDNGSHWESCFEFTNIRHVHGVFFDVYENCFWATTGDEDHEAAIWKIDPDWKRSERILFGSQQSRVIDLLFSPTEIFFGTDAPDQPNWICSMDRSRHTVNRIAPVNGTVFHAKTSGNNFYFSTACEPGSATSKHSVDLLQLKDGKLETLINLRKDFWNMKYFQYGQIQFASGNQDPNQIWISPLATTGDQQSLLVETQHPNEGQSS